MEQAQEVERPRTDDAAAKVARVKKTWERLFGIPVESIPVLAERRKETTSIATLAYVFRKDLAIDVIPTATELDVHPSIVMRLVRDFNIRIEQKKAAETDALLLLRKRSGLAIEAAQTEQSEEIGLTAADIIGAVGRAADLAPKRVFEHTRTVDIVRARRVAQFLMSRLLKKPKSEYAAIGRHFKMDHSTVYVGCDAVRAVIASRAYTHPLFILVERSCGILGVTIASL